MVYLVLIIIGVKNAKTIIAVNTDVNAPIVTQSDYVLIMDMFKVIPEMIRWLISWKAKNKQTIKSKKQMQLILFKIGGIGGLRGLI
ncbi:hypothetical protein ACA081_01315 [Candidatus Hodgkinia cicadicola]